MSDLDLPIRSAYLRPGTLASWSDERLRAWTTEAAAQGLEALITKLPAITPALAAVCADAGLDVVGSFTCYSAHDGSSAGTTPVDPEGREFEPVEWYTGLVPGDPVLEDRRAASLDELLRRGLVRVVVLDFIRWPGHWETESRGGAAPRASSFDPGTLRRFATYLAERGIDAPIDADDPRAAADAIAGLDAEWTAFRADTVTGFAARLAGIAHRHGVSTGAFLVPLPHETRVRMYGQDAVGMAPPLDFFVPMTYHAIAGRPTGWVREVVDEVRAATGRPTLAMVQTTSDREFSGGSDWGAAIVRREIAELVERLDGDLASGELAGYCLFPGEAPLPQPTTTEGQRR